MNKSLDVALDLIRRGYHIFPVSPNAKNPANGNGVSGASNDEKQIRSWFTNKNNNIGVACWNVVVVDVDVKGGKGNGIDDLWKLERFGISDKGNVVSTPSGGMHFYFKSPKENLIGRAGIRIEEVDASVDIRVGNQYVLSEKSTINGGEYVTVKQLKPLDSLPEVEKELIDVLPKKEVVQAPVKQEPYIPKVSRDVAVERCRSYLNGFEPAVQGSCGQNVFYRACYKVFTGFGLEKEDGIELLKEYNSRCCPPWDLSNPNDSRWFYRTVNQQADNRGPDVGHMLEQTIMPISVPINEESFNNLVANIEKSIREEKQRKALAAETINAQDDLPSESINKFGVIPEELLNVPGFINDCLDLLKEKSTAYNHHACFAGVVSLLSTLMGPKFICHGLGVNLYMIILSPSGSGKDAPRKFNNMVFSKIGRPTVIGRSFSSGEAIEDELYVNPVKLYQVDECDFLFNTMSSAKETFQKSIQSNLLEMYTSGSNAWTRRTKATCANDVRPPQIFNWFVSLLGTAPPKSYYGSLSKRMIEGGLFGRLLVINSPGCETDMYKSGVQAKDISENIIRQAEWFSEYAIEENQDVNLLGVAGQYDPKDIPITKEAMDMSVEFFNIMQSASEKLDLLDEGRRTVYARATEKVYKFAALYTLSKQLNKLTAARLSNGKIDYEKVNQLLVVDEEAMDWAIRFIKAVLETQLFDLGLYSYETTYEKASKEIYETILKSSKKNKTGLMLRTTILRQVSSMSVADLNKLLEDLVARRRIEYTSIKTDDGRTLDGYRAI